MADKCTVCGCEGYEMFTAEYGGKKGEYCNVSCLVHDLAPKCCCCGCTILGHVFHNSAGDACCCESCAK